MNLIIEVLIYIFATFGVLSFIWIMLDSYFKININEIHNDLKGDERIELLIIFKNFDSKYYKIIESSIINGYYNNINDIVDEYRTIFINSRATISNLIDKTE